MSHRALIATALCCAAALRLTTLGIWPVWIDEAFTLHDARNTPPAYSLYYHLTALVIWLLGDSEWAIRSLPCIAGLTTIGLLAWADDGRNGKRRDESPGTSRAGPTAPLASLLLALSAFHLFWSQSARYYTTQSLAVLVAFLCVTRRDTRNAPGNPRRLMVAATALALAVACHPSGALFAPGLFLVALLQTPPKIRWPMVIAGALMAAAAAIAYGPVLLGQRELKGTGSTLQFVTSFGFMVGPVMLSLAAWGGFCDLRRGHRPLALMVATTGLTFLAMSFVVFTTGYHAFSVLPFIAWLAARGCVALPHPWKHVLTALLLLELLAGLGLYHASHGMRPRTRAAGELVAAAQADGCRVFATHVPPIAFYTEPDRHNLRTPAGIEFLDDYLLGSLEAALTAGEPVCLITHPDDLHDWDPLALDRLQALIQGQLPRHAVLRNSFGPKGLSLTVHRTP